MDLARLGVRVDETGPADGEYPATVRAGDLNHDLAAFACRTHRHCEENRQGLCDPLAVDVHRRQSRLHRECDADAVADGDRLDFSDSTLDQIGGIDLFFVPLDQTGFEASELEKLVDRLAEAIRFGEQGVAEVRDDFRRRVVMLADDARREADRSDRCAECAGYLVEKFRLQRDAGLLGQ